jgi:PAS domain S-box-containing protein
MAHDSQMLQLVLDTIPVRVFWKDRRSIYLGCNRHFARDAGLEDPAEIVGKNDLELGWRDQAELYRRDDREVMESGTPKLGYEEPQTTPEGGLIWLRTSKIPLRNEHGEVVGVLGTYEDITASKVAEESLRQKTEELERFFSLALDLLCIADVDGRFLRLNRAWVETLGYRLDELEGRTFIDLVHPDDREATRGAVAKLAAGETVINFVNRYRAADGSYRHIEWRSMPFEKRLIYAAARDISERVRADDERRRLEAQLLHAQKLESLGVLAGGIAHDFNNLLTGILGNAELAELDTRDTTALACLQEIQRASRRAAELCRQMLAYSGKGRFVIEQLDLSELVREIAGMLEHAISKKATLALELASALPGVEADATQIRQVVMNLITNASESLGDRSGTIRVVTSARRCALEELRTGYLDDHLAPGEYVVCEVSDTGCGMTPEVKARLFDPFFTTKFTGRGLGMAAVLGIVRGHRGAITVESEPGKGTTIRLLLPASGRVAAALPIPASVPEPTRDDWRGSGAVLVVDDEQVVRTVAERFLARLGFEVICAPDGEAALELLREQVELRCVLLDLTMPRLNGEETYRELRGLRPELPVILMSGYNEQDAVERFTGRGLAGFLQKPFQIDRLRACLQAALAEPKR